tara:strand:+ start:1898 stop:2629 length:732 start_codon:yes stop_codon:yes gene_type:complete
MYLQAFLDFRTQYSEEIYSRETLSLLQVILGGEGARITTICRPDVRADYTGISPVLDDIDIEIVQIATQECLTTGNPLVLPESLQWRYEFTLFFGLLFTKYDEYSGILEFQNIMWELMRLPSERIAVFPDVEEWNNLCARQGWNTFMVHQALDSVSDGSWTGGDNWSWRTFLINDLVEAKAFIKDGTWWLTKTVYKVVKDKLDDSASDNDDDWFANIMEKQCEQIRLGVTMTPLKSLNYPKGA